MGCYTKNRSNHWVGARVPFEISPGVTNPGNVTAAIAVWEQLTVARFVQRTTEEDFVSFVQTSDTASSSAVGRQGGKQQISLGVNAQVSTIVHEIGHALGLQHEHQRPDRDDYIKVHSDRIQPGEEHNFAKLSSDKVGVAGRYDFTSRMHYDAFTFAERLAYDWTSGWTTVEFYQAGGTTHLLLLRKSGFANDDMNVHIHAMNSDGTVGARVDSRKWSAGWTQAKPFIVAGQPFLFLLKEGDGSVHVHRLEADGKVGPEVKRYKWTSGWTTVEFYQAGGTTYLLLLRKSGLADDGMNVHIHAMNADGTVGARVDSRKWSAGWTHAKPFTVAGQPFLFLHKEVDGSVHLHRLEAAGKVGAELKQYTWTSGWTSVEFYQAGGSTYLLLLKKNGLAEDGKNVHIHAVNADGTVGARVDSRRWTEGWTQAKPYLAGGRPRLFLLKEEDGTVHPHLVSNDGTILARQAMFPVLEPLGGNRIGSVATLSPQDIDAAHEMLHGNVHIHTLTAGGGVGRKIDVRRWSEGWTQAKPFAVAGQPFLFLLKQSDGSVHVHRLEASGRVGSEVKAYDWTAGWTTVEFYQVARTTYLLMLKKNGMAEDNMNVHVHTMNADGTAGAQIDSRKWSSGWTQAKPFTVAGQSFLFLLKEADGTVHVHRIEANGKIGAEVKQYNWTSGWTTVEFYQTSSGTYLLLLKKDGMAEDDMNVHVHAMNTDGTVGARVDSRKWSSGWTQAKPFTIAGQPFLFLIKEADGTVHVHRLEIDGKVGAEVARYNWTGGWTTVEPYEVAGGQYLLLLKARGD